MKSTKTTILIIALLALLVAAFFVLPLIAYKSDTKQIVYRSTKDGVTTIKGYNASNLSFVKFLKMYWKAVFSDEYSYEDKSILTNDADF